MGKQKAGALTENRNSSSQNGFHPRVPPPPFPAAVFSGRSYVFLLTGSKNNGCNVIAWFNLLCMIHFLLWKSFYPLSAPQAEYTPYQFTNLIYFSEKHRSKKHPDAIPAPPEFQGAMTQHQGYGLFQRSNILHSPESWGQHAGSHGDSHTANLVYIHKLISQSRSRKRGFPKLSHHDGIGHIDTDGDHALQGNRNGDNCHFFIKTFVFYQ